jgi:choline dehydrogenase-like flavoprotein
MTPQPHYDVLVVGAGVAGSIIASELGKKGKRVLILNAGTPVPANRRGYMEDFFPASAKTPESPYLPLERARDNPPVNPTDPGLPGAETTPRPTLLGLDNWTNTSLSDLVQPAPDPEHAPRNLPFSSTDERSGGGTTWLGTSLRLVPHDLTMYSTYGVFGTFADWPITYEELQADYGRAEAEIGVSASVAEQAPLEPAIGLSYAPDYQYPLDSIPSTMVDRFVDAGTRGMSIEDEGRRYPIFVSPTPAGRNSQPYQGRSRCAGSTSCIPICPVQAKWDATVSLNHAVDTGHVTVIDQAVVRRVQVDAAGRVSGVEYLSWSTQTGLNPREPPPAETAHATLYVLAAHAMENAKLLLNSRTAALPGGVANASDQVGRNLMDHVLYVSWALAPEDRRVYPFRGPLTTAGIESLRDGDFRRRRSAFRIEIGNEGWNVPIGDPWITVNDFINGTNNSRLNPITPPGQPLPAASPRYAGAALVQALNGVMTRQFRLTCLVEQSPMSTNRVTLHPTLTDGLGIPRPKIDYSFDEYTLNGFRAARRTCSAIYERIGATEFTDFSGRKGQPGYFEIDGVPCKFSGAGHVVGTHRMGSDRTQSVVDSDQRAHDHRNLWIVGSGSFPTAATPNPTLTIAALAFRTSRSILSALGS